MSRILILGATLPIARALTWEFASRGDELSTWRDVIERRSNAWRPTSRSASGLPARPVT